MRASFYVAMLAIGSGAAPAEIIDRIAVVVGERVITQSEILLQMRVAAFLNGAAPAITPASKRQAAERLIEQTLVRREMDMSRYPAPNPPEADAVIASLRKRPQLSSDAAFSRELARYRVSEDDLRQQVLWQLTLLRFIDYRFRPAVAASEQDLKTYYEKQFLPQWKKRSGQPPPSLEDSRADLEKTVQARLLDEALDRWMKQARAQTRIRFREEVFR